MRLPVGPCLLALAACADEPAAATRVDGLIRHARLYSAFDGVHDYRVVLTVSPDVVKTDDPDARVDWTSVRWTTDSSFVHQADFPELAGAALLTTKRAGKTHISVSLDTTEGAHLLGQATLEISEASLEEWELAEIAFSRGGPILPPPPENRGACGLPEVIELPSSRVCTNCHNRDSRPLGGPCSPLDTAEYPNDELIETFVRGAQPRGGFAPGGLLAKAIESGGEPECIFTRFHSAGNIDESAARGVLWRLRAVDPAVPDTFDPELINP